MKLEQLQEMIPAPLLALLNWGTFGAALGWVFTTVVPAIVGVLSGIWLGMQIYIAWRTKPWRRK